MVVKADGEGGIGHRDSPGQDNSNSSSGLDAAVSSSTPGAGGDRDATASPNPLKKDDKDGANKSRGSSREKDSFIAAAGGGGGGRRIEPGHAVPVPVGG